MYHVLTIVFFSFLTFFFSESDVNIQKSHCASETNNRFQQNLCWARKQVRLLKCCASSIWPCIHQNLVSQGVDCGPTLLGFRSSL